MIKQCRILLWYVFITTVSMTSVSNAVEPKEMLKNPSLESRARVISKDLRCVVCQNENIDESSATLAKDMRRLVRIRIVAGDTNKEVIDYMVSRYGDFVLLKPRVKPYTWFLWFGPLLMLTIGVSIVFFYVKRVSHTVDK
tara:strand:+ start:201 stop:620 length:420 start_codon:yes stop_codon:yes gene_type:complete